MHLNYACSINNWLTLINILINMSIETRHFSTSSLRFWIILVKHISYLYWSSLSHSSHLHKFLHFIKTELKLNCDSIRVRKKPMHTCVLPYFCQYLFLSIPSCVRRVWMLLISVNLYCDWAYTALRVWTPCLRLYGRLQHCGLSLVANHWA